ncbi:autotransporter outer membrane beta-barrel domain-containing protein [Turicimonas muris]|uniref:autotransporter outer membrane beta-barrel domain-containing protein n=1 Tax=Turicimonas muris TaxID=1796652 RepID=UPI0023F05AFA|nr:autotransporter outer membrane beta-barrel domain-containing protein [Turicimonas muris]
MSADPLSSPSGDVSQQIFDHIENLITNTYYFDKEVDMSGVGTMMVLASAPHTKTDGSRAAVAQFVESIGKIGSYAERSSEPHTQLALRGAAFHPTLSDWRGDMDTPIIVQHLGNVGEINAIEAGVLHAEGRTAGVQLLSNVGQINIVGAGYTIRGSDTPRFLNHAFGVYNWGTAGYTIKNKVKNLPVQQQVILTKGISVRAALGSETEIGNFQSEGGLDYLLNKSGRDVIWGNFKNYEKFNSQKPQEGDREKAVAAAIYNRGGVQEIWSEAFDGVVISTEEDKSLVDGKYQKQLQNAQVFSVLVSPEFRRESGIWTSGGKDKPLSWDGIREYSVENGFGLAAWQDLTTKTELSGNFRFAAGDIVVQPHQQFDNMVKLTSHQDSIDYVKNTFGQELRADVVLQFAAAREKVPVYMDNKNKEDEPLSGIWYYEKGDLKKGENGEIFNTTWLNDEVNIKVFPAVGYYDEAGKVASFEKSKHYFLLGDSTKADDPGYNIHLGKRSEINVKGTYSGNGTLWFGVDINKENLTVEAIDNQGNSVHGLNGAISVNRNPIVLDDAVRGSSLNLVVNLSNNQAGVSAQQLKNYFKYDASGRAGQLLQQAANNVFIGDFIEKATGPGTLNTHAGLEITAEDLADFQAKLQASGNAQNIEITADKTFAQGMKNEDISVKYVWQLNQLKQWVQVPITEKKITDVSGKMVAGKVSIYLDETLLEPAETFSTIYYIENSEWVANPNDISDSLATEDRERNEEIASDDTQGTGKARAYALAAAEPQNEQKENSEEDRKAHQSNLGEGTIFARPEEPDPTPVIHDRPDDSSSTVKTLNSASIINYFLWRQENETLYQRMGEVRDNANLEGLWFRGLAGKNTYDKNKYYYRNKYYGIQLGIDHLLKKEKGGTWLLGLGLTYTKGDSKLGNGGKDDNWIGTISAYATRQWNNGAYVDFIVKGSRLNNDFTAISDLLSDGSRYISKGKFHTYGLQASAEVGKKYMFGKGWYLDPELQLTYGHLRAAKYLTDTGVTARIKSSNSLIGRAGVGFGKEGKSGSAFVKVDALREFTNQFKAHYTSNDGGEASSRINMKDTWGEITVGGTYNFKKNVYGFAQAKRSFAADIKQDYRFDAGIRIIF